MNDDNKDIQKDSVDLDIDEENIDDHIVELLNKKEGKKKQTEDDNIVLDDIEDDVDDVVSEDENPKALIKKLRAELKEAKQEKMDVMTSWQRDKADFLNARKRDQETQADVIRFANQALISDLLPTLDGYEQAKAQPSWNEVNETWRGGIEALMTKIYTSLQKVGIEAYGAVGDVFDPNLHEAIGNESTTDTSKDHTIALVMQRGYKLHDKVIRPALVKVFQA